MFTRIRKAKLKLNLEKYIFWIKWLFFLEHIIEAKGIFSDPEKIIVIQNILPSKNVTQLYSFLGLARYYRRFIQEFSAITQLLNQLLYINIKYE